MSTPKYPELFIDENYTGKIKFFHDDPIEMTSKDGAFKWTIIPGGVLDEKGNKCTALFPGEKETVFGFGYKTEMNDPTSIKGIKTTYPATSAQTMNNPTKKEAHFLKITDLIYDAGKATITKESSRKPKRLIPNVTYNSYSTEKNDAKTDEREMEWENVIKPIVFRPTIKDPTSNKYTDEPDMEKPLKGVFSLDTRGGKGKDLTIRTELYGPGDKPINPLNYISTDDNLHMADLEPIFRYDGMYVGNHGTAPYGASHKITIVDGNFTPKKADKAVSRRYLAPNTAPVEEVEDGDDDQIPDYTSPKVNTGVNMGNDDEEEAIPEQSGSQPISAPETNKPKSIKNKKPLPQATVKPIVKKKSKK